MAILAATWGLFVVFVVHDAEEWVTMPGWVARNAARLKRLYPRIPDPLLRRLDMSALQVRVGIVLMGVIVLLAAADGARTAGRSAFFQVVLIGFGVHALFHVGQAVLAHGYTPGVVTAVVFVAPYALWAWDQLETTGSVSADPGGTAVIAVVLVVPLIVAVHFAALVLLRMVRRPRHPNS